MCIYSSQIERLQEIIITTEGFIYYSSYWEIYAPEQYEQNILVGCLRLFSSPRKKEEAHFAEENQK